MTPDEINLMIAEWAGVKPQDNCQYSWCEFPGVKCDPSCKNKVFTYPDYFGSNAAMDLLVVLVERGYQAEMHTNAHQTRVFILGFDDEQCVAVAKGIGDTIPAAICTAIMELIEREGKE